MMTKVRFEDVFDGLQILPSRDYTEGKFIDILKKQTELMEFAIANHSKVMQVRFDLHYPSDGSILPSPDHIYDFSYNLTFGSGKFMILLFLIIIFFSGLIKML